MTWTKVNPYHADTLVGEIDRVTKPSPNSIIATTTVAMLLAAKELILAGDKNPSLAETLRERGRVSPVFRPVLLAAADEVS